MDGNLPDHNGKKPPIFDTRITLGSVVQIIVLLVAIMWWAATQSGRISILESTAVRTEADLASINSKIDVIDSKINDLAFQAGQQAQKLEDERRESQRENQYRGDRDK